MLFTSFSHDETDEQLMERFAFRNSCLLYTSASVWGQANLSQIDSLIKRMLPEASEVGISVYDLTAKKSLYTYRDTKLSRPASTMKLLTAITALSRPDADNPFRTEVWHDGVIEHDTLQGNLYVVGGFDPEFDSLMMDSLIEEVITFPFSVINGQVYGDVSMKDSLYWGHGWAWDDTCLLYTSIAVISAIGITFLRIKRPVDISRSPSVDTV